jgi:hypothetical protein
MKNLLTIILVLIGLESFAQPFKTQNVILITIDGFRWQEVFTGADSALLNNQSLVKNSEVFKKKYWNNNPVERRSMLMPFLWETIATNGQIYGNRINNCKVNVRNPYQFSYPGYNEIFCGFADIRVNSNEFGPNPNKNVLEFIHQSKGFNGKVAVFSSWDVFPDILNRKRSGIMVNAAFEKNSEAGLSAGYDEVIKMQNQLPDVLGGARLDAMTYHLGFEYLKAKKPRVLYLAFDETDDFAHDGRYDFYLNSARYTDGFLKELWTWVQSQPEYRDKTTLFITVDHGRGVGEPGWRSHGEKTEHSGETWFAVMGPDTPALGEVTGGQYYNEQYAQTLASLLGITYVNEKTPGTVIPEVTGNKKLVVEVKNKK